MGKNELRPLTKDGFQGSMFGELTQTSGASSASLLSWVFQAFMDSEDPSAPVHSYILTSEHWSLGK